MPKSKPNLIELIRTNIIGVVLTIVMGGLFSFGLAQYQRPIRQSKKANDSIVVITKSLDSLAWRQQLNRKDLDSIMRHIPQIKASQHKTEREVSEIKGMLEILIALERKKDP